MVSADSTNRFSGNRVDPACFSDDSFCSSVLPFLSWTPPLDMRSCDRMNRRYLQFLGR